VIAIWSPGVPTPYPDHAETLAQLALDMQAYAKEHIFLENQRLTFRIGINTGPLVAGVIGQKKFIYDLWGDTVNTASRMEAHGVQGSIQVTRSTYELIKDEFDCTSRGIIDVKGKGEMEVWQVSGKNKVP